MRKGDDKRNRGKVLNNQYPHDQPHVGMLCA